MDILLATHNDHKILEIHAILAGAGLRLHDLRGDYPDLGELPETGKTFIDNALQKARAAWQGTGVHPCVADDSGIEIDALGGAPGVHSKRFSAEGTDTANNALLLARLAGRADRTARYRCAIALVSDAGEAVATGTCEGRIVLVPRGVAGFGYDPLFLPDAYPGRTMAELTLPEKNRISHRGRAFRELPGLLDRLRAR
jgi:XTP/dITP diphosphohydrolase